MTAAAPFAWERLPRLGLREVRLRNRAAAGMPPGAGASWAAGAAAEALSRRVGRPVSLSVFDVAVGRAEALIRRSATGALRFRAEGVAAGDWVELHLDRAPAAELINLLLGRPVCDPWAPGRMTGVEAGLVGYLLLEAMAAATGPQARPAAPALRLVSAEDVGPGAPLRPADDTECWAVSLAVEVDRLGGLAQLIGPVRDGEGVASAAWPAPARPPIGTLVRRVGRVGVDLTARLGRLSLASAAGLAVEAVLRLEEHDVRPGEGGLAGKVGLVPFGADDAWVWPAEIRGDDYAGCRVGLSSSEPLTTPTMPPTNEQPSSATAPSAATAPAPAEAVRRLPVRLSVEMGSLRMTVEQVAGLQPGQVLELHKHPDEPVSLCVDGRVVARGELVLIEGEIGVRILRLVE
jgi:flagellar motor switch protein FliM